MSYDHDNATVPRMGGVPSVGRSATRPHSEAGTRNDPVVSVPSPASAIPVAVAAAGPELEPPQSRLVSSGLGTSPQCGLRPSIP